MNNTGNSGNLPINVTSFSNLDPVSSATMKSWAGFEGCPYTEFDISHTILRSKSPGPMRQILSHTGHWIKVSTEISNALSTINKAKNTEDVMERATSASYLLDSLKNLWDLRIGRENEFKDLVNILYLHLKNFILEDVSNDFLDAYYKVIDQVLKRTVRADDFEIALDILSGAGIDLSAILADEKD